SANFSKNELVNYLESVGSRFGPDLNAYTSFDETVYMLQVRTDEPDHFNKGMLILRDWADGVAFESNEIDKERGVVISEWRTGLSPEQRMMQKYLPLIYYKSRYADRLPIGDPEILKTVPYDAVRRFYKDWYRPDLMAILVVGDINIDSVELKIKNQFGTIGIQSSQPVGKREKTEVSFPPHDETFVRVITDPEASNSRVRIIYKHKYDDSQNLVSYRERLMYSLFNRMLGKRLAEIAREADPPFVFGFSGYDQDVGEMGSYTSIAIAEAKNIKKAYKTLLEENQRVLLHGFTQSELDREKAALMRVAEQNVIEQDKQESSRIVQRLVNHFLEKTPIANATQVLELYKAMMPTISVEETSQLAERWIIDRNRVIIMTASEKDKAMLPDSTELIKMMNEVSSVQLAPYEDIDVSAPLLTGSFPVRPILNIVHDTVLDIYHWQFENGIKVTAKPTSFKNDEILMNAYSPGCHSLYDDKMYPSARSTSSVVGSSGVGTFNATALDKKLSGLRVSVSPFIFERQEGFNGTSSVADLETMMQLIYSYTTAFRKDTVALNAFLSREKGMFANLLANPGNWYSDKVTKITTQNHPRRGFPTMESYDEINMDDIMKIYTDRFKDVSDMHFFFVGNFDPDSLQKLTSRYLGALPGGKRNETWKDVGDRMPSGRIDSVYYRGEAPKSLVQLIYHGMDAYDPDSAYLLQSLIDLARIKLRESLREEESGVYGVSISGGQSLYPVEQYSIRVSFNADPTRTSELVENANDVIQKMKTEIEPSDIAKVTEIQRQSRIRELKQNQFWMGAFINSWLNNTDLKQQVDMKILEKRISMLNKDVLLRAARKYFNEGQLISVVMYPGKT
ncbi:MAG TPA: insulinase family protein, partial [Saprospiraceae bacterium]|nr:insulinase family protein [Saprospiraceae bacterium]